MNEDIALDKFLDECDNLIYKLRSGEKFNESELFYLIDFLKKIEPIYSNQDSVPKSLAGILFDMSTALYSSANSTKHAFDDEKFILFDRFCEAARNVLN